MKRISIKATMGLAAILLLTAACTDELNDHPADTGRPIAFTPVAETRAAVEGSALPSGSSFRVWGWYGTGNDINKNVFNNPFETVMESNGSWGYTGGTQYWIPGMTYNFYGVYPASVTASVTNDGIITVEGFDCSKAVDLMTASATDVSADGMIYNSGSVSLQFRHLLSLLNFSFENQLTSHAIDITNLRLSVAVTGDCQSSPSPTWVNLASDKTELILHPAGNPLQVGKKASASTPLLVIPQSNTDVTVTFTVNIREVYSETGGGSLIYSKRYTASLATGKATDNAWRIGNRYNYTATIPTDIMNGEDITLTVSIKDWDEEDASVSWGGKD